MIKHRDLCRWLQENGCELLRQGKKHEIWGYPGGRQTTVARHREIPRTTANAICDQLGIPRTS
jgi:mRNA interferase HicA